MNLTKNKKNYKPKIQMNTNLHKKASKIEFSKRTHFQEFENILFKQLLYWFISKKNYISKFTKIALVGPRRNQNESFIYNKLGSNHKKVLKTFCNLNIKKNQILFVHDVIIPFIINDESILKSESIMFDSKVNLKRSYMLSILFRKVLI